MLLWLACLLTGITAASGFAVFRGSVVLQTAGAADMAPGHHRLSFLALALPTSSRASPCINNWQYQLAIPHRSGRQEEQREM